MERGDKITVEASRPLFVVGQPAKVTFDQYHGLKGGPLVAIGRAISPTLVLFDIDQAIGANAIDKHEVFSTTVTVEQTVGGQNNVFHSATAWRFDIDLLPRTLHSVAQNISDKT